MLQTTTQNLDLKIKIKIKIKIKKKKKLTHKQPAEQLQAVDSTQLRNQHARHSKS